MFVRSSCRFFLNILFGSCLPTPDVEKSLLWNICSSDVRLIPKLLAQATKKQILVKVADLSTIHFRKQSHRWHLQIQIHIGFQGLALIQGQIYNPACSSFPNPRILTCKHGTTNSFPNLERRVFKTNPS